MLLRVILLDPAFEIYRYPFPGSRTAAVGLASAPTLKLEILIPESYFLSPIMVQDR